jgi:hypothetical protein
MGAGLILFYTLTGDTENINQIQQTNIVDQKNKLSKPINKPIPKVATKEIAVANTQLSQDILVEDNQLTQEDVVYSGITRISDEAKAILEEAGVLPEDLSEEAYVEFDLDTLRGLEVGDTFNLEIPQTSEMFSTEVTKVEEFNNGDKSVFGRLIGSDGAFHTSVLTVGVDAVYGQFTTVSGNYVFESKGKHGWLAAKRDLYKKHVEFEAINPEPSTEASSSIIAPPLD